MNTSGTLASDAAPPRPAVLPSALSRERVLAMRGEPFFYADWDRTLMLHYEVPPQALQPFVPFELDLKDGNAYVSLVAFTMRDLRPRLGGLLSRLLFRPIATHAFLNVRTYVRHAGESGIFFLAEWLPNRLSVLLGRPVFGLPFRHGRLCCQHLHERGTLHGSVEAARGSGTLRYKAALPDRVTFKPGGHGTLTEFLMERYTAFTTWLGWKRRFRVWHEPWPQCGVDATIEDDSLLHLTGDWARKARFIGANYSPGVQRVWMTRPARARSVPLPEINPLLACKSG